MTSDFPHSGNTVHCAALSGEKLRMHLNNDVYLRKGMCINYDSDQRGGGQVLAMLKNTDIWKSAKASLWFFNFIMSLYIGHGIVQVEGHISNESFI